MTAAPQRSFRLHPPLQFLKLDSDDGLPQQHVTAIVQDEIGFLWFGTEEGLARYDGREIEVYKHDENLETSLGHNYVTSLAVAADGALWVGTLEAGLSRYDPDKGTFARFKHERTNPNGLSADGVTALVRDAKNRLWIGTGDGTLDIREGTAFRHVLTEELEVPINALADDGTGAMWVATDGEGLLRIEEDKIGRFRHGDETSLADDRVSAVLKARDGTLWIGTKSGLDRWEPATGRFSHHRHTPGDLSSLPDDRVTVLLEDHGGTLWVGTEIGLATFDPKTGRFTSYLADFEDPTSTSTYPDHVTSAFEDRSGVVWFGGLQQGLRRFDELRRGFGSHLGSAARNTPDVFAEGLDGAIWGGTNNSGLYRYDFERNQVTVYASFGTPGSQDYVELENFLIGALLVDRKQRLWIARDGLGLIQYDTKTGRHRVYRASDEVLGSERVVHLAEGRAGEIWIATWGGGLSRLDPETERFQRFTSTQDDDTTLGSNYLLTVLPDSDAADVLWVGTARGGLNRFEMGAQVVRRYLHTAADPSSIGADSIYSIHQDASGALWLGLDGGGLNRFDPKTERAERYTTKQGLSHDTVYGILEDEEGHLWLSTNGGGLTRFDPSKRAVVATYDASDGLQSNEFTQNGYLRRSSGELLFAGTHGFNAFRASEIQSSEKGPRVVLAGFKLFNEEVRLERAIWNVPGLHLSHRDSVITLRFAALSYAAPRKNRIDYMLEGLIDQWLPAPNGEVTYTKLEAGDYVLHVRATNRDGLQSGSTLKLPLRIDPPPWRSWWAYSLYALSIVGSVAAVALAYTGRQRKRIQDLERKIRLEKVERDLALTGAVQKGFLPRNNVFEGQRVRVVGFHRAADVASGDWWWYEGAAGKRHVVLLGDVTGHGPGPAMVTAAVATAFRVQSRISNDYPLETRLLGLNEQVLATSGGHYQMTMSAVELEEESGAATFYFAGGLPFLLIRATGKSEVHQASGTPLGSPDFEVGRRTGNLVAGDRLLVASDGIPETRMPDGSMFGMRKFRGLFEQSRSLPVHDAAQFVVREVDKLRGNAPQEDDWTFTLIEYVG